MIDQSSGPQFNTPKLKPEIPMTTKLDARAVDLSNGDGTGRRIHEMDDFKLVGVPVTVAGDSIRGPEMAAVAVEVKTDVKRKRGRPPRGQGKLPPAKKQKEKEDEDVCFICFDGGSLVVCDRRSCPKAYHPACIKRDEAFFQSKAKWTCGWHICSVCEKPAHYMCYTCTYSLCKGCTKDADYVCVRGDKGFCVTCMKTIMLMEDEELRNKEMAGLNFDDASSWEYLFKIYWVYLKGNLSLTNKELAEAKNPWKESVAMAYKGQSSNIHGYANNFKSSVLDMSTEQPKGNDPVNPESNELVKRLNEDSISTKKQRSEKRTSSVVTTKWATEELLNFVAYMKNDDVSVLSQSDVQALVLDYVRVNNLWDPHQESHVVCDLRLETLFGKRRVSHFELLKLLDFHFLIKVESANNVVVQGGVVDVNSNQVLSEPSNTNLIAKDKKSKTHKKGKACGLQANPNDYAMIDVPTISLIYLRRNLMEKLIKVKDKFHEMVVGSVVRIRIAGGEQKQDMYRLVQVVGTIKVSEPYKINDTTADVMLEVLNLDKREVVSIAAISNQDVSEDDCRRLRQSIKCRLVKCFTVGEILEKAKLLQPVRLNDSLEAEMSRLNHLRNQAIEKGSKKELIECVEKLHILKTPEERQRRLSQILEVHSDPTMDPNYESEEDADERDNGKKSHQVKPSNSKHNREVSVPVSLKKEDISDDNDSRPSSPSCEQNRNLCASYPDKEESAAKALQRLSEGKDSWRPNSLERVGGNSQTVASSPTLSVISSEMSTASLPVGNIPFAYNGETMLWHYRDPNGNIQGPFCMSQLQQWSTTGYFPLDMRIWANDKQDDSILLSDALNGQIQKAFPWLNNISPQVREVGGNSDSKSFNTILGWNENINAPKDGRQTEGNWSGNVATVNSSSKTDIASGRLDTQSSVWTAPIVSCNKDMTAVSCSQDHESFRGNGSCHKPHQAHSPLSSSMLAVRDYVNHRNESNYEVKKGNSNSGHENMDSHRTTICNSTTRHVLGNHYNSQGFPSQSSVENSNHSPVNFSSKNLDLNSTFSPTKSTDSPDQSGEVNVMNFSSPSQKAGYVDCEYEVTENKESVSSSAHFHDPGTLNPASPSTKINGDYQKSLSVEKKQYVSSKVSFQDSVPSWSSISNISVGRPQLADITDVWGGYASAPVKHSLEWDSNLISVSSLLHDHVGTANTRNGELNHFNLSHPSSNISGWHTSASGPIEFDTLAEESVSDLLAEVDAMESQCGLPSPTSMRNTGEDLINLNLEMA